MGSLLLASTLTIYIGGLVMFVPGPSDGQLEILMLRGNKWSKHHKTRTSGKLHNAPIGGHEPYLVASAAQVDLHNSTGFRVLGSHGPDQIVRFPLAGRVTLANMVGTGIDVDKELTGKIAAVGYGAKGVCSGEDQTLRPATALGDWPIAAYLDLNGVAAVNVFGEKGTLKFKKDDKCPAQTDVYEGVEIRVEVSKPPTFTWGRSGKATLQEKLATWSMSLWNLPNEDTTAMPAMASHHFDAFFSVLSARKACTCEVDRDAYSTQPAFCPPSRGKRD